MDSLTEALNNIIMSDEGYRDLERFEFRGSSAWKCDLSHYLMKLFPESIIKVKRGMKGVFMWGTAIHEYLQKRLELDDIERTISWKGKNVSLSAHCDGIFNGNRLVEFKSANHWAFQHRENEEAASPHHISQANLMAFLMEIPLFTIIYIDKGCSSKYDTVMNQFTYKTDNAAGREMLDKLERIGHNLKISISPTPNPLSWECRYCDVREKCKALGLKPSKSINNQVKDALEADKL